MIALSLNFILKIDYFNIEMCSGIDKQMRVNRRLMVVFADVGPQMLYGKAQPPAQQ